ncbi:hypothetical protein BJX99DRAFT_260799 [Aspergillus californicus]
MASNTVFPILDLPPELLDIIASFVYPYDVRPLRQTCRYIYSCTSRCFARTELDIIRTDLSFRSLLRLEDIARHKGFAPYVNTLVIENEYGNDIGQGIAWEWDAFGNLDLQQAGVHRVQAILQSFKNCRSFQFARYRSCEDNKTPEPLALGEAINMTLTIAVNLKRQIKAFDMFDIWSRSAEPDAECRDLKGLTMMPTEWPEFMDVWPTVSSLVLSYQAGSPSGVPVSLALNLLQHAPKLRRLHVDSAWSTGGASIMDYLLSTKLGFELEELHLGTAASVRGDDLQTFLSEHRRTLRTLIFDELNLQPGNWIPTLCSMTTGFPKLSSVNFTDISEGLPRDTHWVDYPELAKSLGTKIISRLHDLDRSSRVWSVFYRGPKMEIALQKMADSATILSWDEY